jgi:hypothetical protein
MEEGVESDDNAFDFDVADVPDEAAELADGDEEPSSEGDGARENTFGLSDDDDFYFKAVKGRGKVPKDAAGRAVQRGGGGLDVSPSRVSNS